MKTSKERILTTHVGSIPRPESLRLLLRARLAGQSINQRELDAEVEEAVTDVVRKQAESGIDIVNDGEMGKSSFLAYSEDRLNGFTPVQSTDPNTPATSTGTSWSRRIETRREWRNFREYYEEYLPRGMPPSNVPTVGTGPISYKGQAFVQK